MKYTLLRLAEEIKDYTSKAIAAIVMVAFLLAALGALLVAIKWVTWAWTLLTL
ncbi:hypothetical protein KGP40_04355 [Weissella cibaria]|uniref:hypothetical protein n=1 Tax=Weissella cibaria TaxID=137591 RepID=UPI001C1F67EF|nr:hypothetical protein [Weissella cibaria]MBU7561147.1 hypothetical protein [Weissella cibaria]